MNPSPSTFDPWNDCASFATNRYGVPDTPGRLQPPPTRAPSSRPLGHRRHRRGREAHPRRTGTGGLPMTRPAVRMCARCERTASEPFPIREFRAPADPGLCIYACQECVTHCPTLQDSVELRESPSPPLAHDTPRLQGRREGHHDRRPRQGRDRDRRARRTCPVHVHISAMRMPWLQGDAIANTRQLRPPRTQHDQASEAFAGGPDQDTARSNTRSYVLNDPALRQVRSGESENLTDSVCPLDLTSVSRGESTVERRRLPASSEPSTEASTNVRPRTPLWSPARQAMG